MVDGQLVADVINDNVTPKEMRVSVKISLKFAKNGRKTVKKIQICDFVSEPAGESSK